LSGYRCGSCSARGESYALAQEADDSARYFKAFGDQLQQHLVVQAEQMGVLRRSHRRGARLGIERARRHDCERVLLVPGDCPVLDPAEVSTLLRAGGPAPSVAFRRDSLSREHEAAGTAQTLDDSESIAFWRAIGEVAPLAATGERAVWRISVAPARGAEVAEAITASRREQGVGMGAAGKAATVGVAD